MFPFSLHGQGMNPWKVYYRFKDENHGEKKWVDQVSRGMVGVYRVSLRRWPLFTIRRDSNTRVYYSQGVDYRERKGRGREKKEDQGGWRVLCCVSCLPDRSK
jgi:hypothetical protein